VDVEGLTARVFLNAALDPSRRELVVQGGYDCGVDNFLWEVDRVYFR